MANAIKSYFPRNSKDINRNLGNKTYAFDTVAFSEWLTDLRKAILDDTLEKIDSEGQNV